MIFLTLLFVVCILGALIGIKKPWMGGIAGLVIAPFLFLFSTSSGVVTAIISILVFLSISVVYGFMSFMINSGLKGGGHNVGQTFMSGFGAHHPGGIILSDEELNILKDKNIKHAGILSY